MARISKSQKKLDEIRHPKLLAFRGMKIGPIFPLAEDVASLSIGSRGVPRAKTKFPFSDTITREKGDFMNFKTFSHVPYRLKRRLRNKMASRSRSINRD